MVAALSSSNVPALAGLRTRDSSDFSIALVDAWSEVLDILTFYTERLANEAYLGTAIEGRSVFELARLVGYKPSPGVSASTVLAFSLATAPGSPAIVPIAAGTRVQSVPGPGQSPQVFETSAPIDGHHRQQRHSRRHFAAVATDLGGDTSTWIAGTANNIRWAMCCCSFTRRAPNGISSAHGAGSGRVNVTVGDHRTPRPGTRRSSWDQPLPSGFDRRRDPRSACMSSAPRPRSIGANAPRAGNVCQHDAAEHIRPTVLRLQHLTRTPRDWTLPVHQQQTRSIWTTPIRADSRRAAPVRPRSPGAVAGADRTLDEHLGSSRFESASESNPAFTRSRPRPRNWFSAAGTVHLRRSASYVLTILIDEFVDETDPQHHGLCAEPVAHVRQSAAHRLVAEHDISAGRGHARARFRQERRSARRAAAHRRQRARRR